MFGRSFYSANYCFLNPQTIYVIRITCNSFAIRKPDQLIQTIVSVGFGFFAQYQTAKFKRVLFEL